MNGVKAVLCVYCDSKSFLNHVCRCISETRIHKKIVFCPLKTHKKYQRYEKKQHMQIPSATINCTTSNTQQKEEIEHVI